MARNEEKHFGKLNRMLLKQQKEEELKKNPPRPKLNTLRTVQEIKKWLPSITRDIDFNLKQSQVPCYPERKVEEYRSEVERLERIYKAFVRKIKELDPSCDVIPWTERGYSTRKRQHEVKPKQPEESSSVSKKPRETLNSSDGHTSDIRALMSERLSLPVLNSDTEQLYTEERHQQYTCETMALVDEKDLPHCVEDLEPESVSPVNASMKTQPRSSNKAGVSSQTGQMEVGSHRSTSLGLVSDVYGSSDSDSGD